MGRVAKKVFISYRRSDTAARASLVRQSLAKHFGANNVFFDVDTIDPGADFKTLIGQTLQETGVFVAIIGPHWSSTFRSAPSEVDYVAMEIQAAIQASIPVIPVCVDGAPPPAAEALPPNIAPIAKLNVLHLRHESLARDLVALQEAIRSRLSSIAVLALSAERHSRSLMLMLAVLACVGALAAWQYHLQQKESWQAKYLGHLQR